MKTQSVISPAFDLIDVEKQKLIKSALYTVLAVGAAVVADYLQKYGLPDQVVVLAPLVPFIVNFLNKWARENTYLITK